MSPEEEQWPDLTESEQQTTTTQTLSIEELMKYKLKMAEEEKERFIIYNV